jgi:hypothetical protein
MYICMIIIIYINLYIYMYMCGKIVFEMYYPIYILAK